MSALHQIIIWTGLLLRNPFLLKEHALIFMRNKLNDNLTISDGSSIALLLLVLRVLDFEDLFPLSCNSRELHNIYSRTNQTSSA